MSDPMSRPGPAMTPSKVRMRKSAIVTATDLPPRPAQLFAITQKRTS